MVGELERELAFAFQAVPTYGISWIMLCGPFMSRFLAAFFAVAGCAALEATHRVFVTLDNLELGGGMLLVMGLAILIAYLPAVLSSEPAGPAPVGRDRLNSAAELKANVSRLSTQLVTLSSFAKITSSTDPLLTVLHAALRLISRELYLPKVSIFLVDPDTEGPRLVEHTGYNEQEVDILKSSTHGSIVEWVTRKQRVYPDSLTEPGADLESYRATNRIPTLICLPLTIGTDVLGALTVSAIEIGKDDEPVEISRFLSVLASLLAQRIQAGQLMERLQASSLRDDSSGLFVRAHGDEVLEGELNRAGRYGHSVAMMIVDAPGLDRIGQAHGSTVLNRVLQGLAEPLGRMRRGVDTAFRFSPQQMAVVMPHADAEEALSCAGRILDALSRLRFRDAEGLALELSLSIGVATFPGQSSTPDGLISACLEAVQVADSAGGNRGVLIPTVGADPVVVQRGAVPRAD